MAHECNVKVSLCALAVYFVYSVWRPPPPPMPHPFPLAPAHYSTCPAVQPWPNGRLDTFNFYKFNPWQTTATSATLAWQLVGYARLRNAVVYVRWNNFTDNKIYFVIFSVREARWARNLWLHKKLNKNVAYFLGHQKNFEVQSILNVSLIDYSL